MPDPQPLYEQLATLLGKHAAGLEAPYEGASKEAALST